MSKILETSNKSIYLCGFMGCGKSYLGEKLAQDLGYHFIDLDVYIVEKEGMTIPQIFADYGEAHFRALEAKYIRELGTKTVVATGGGAIINPDTAKHAREAGVVIFIDAPFSLCYDRIKGDENRPLATSKTEAELKELFDYRRNIYIQNSHFGINGTLEIDEKIREIRHCLEMK